MIETVISCILVLVWISLGDCYLVRLYFYMCLLYFCNLTAVFFFSCFLCSLITFLSIKTTTTTNQDFKVTLIYWLIDWFIYSLVGWLINAVIYFSKIIELEEELKIVSNNMKSLEIAEQEARHLVLITVIIHVDNNGCVDKLSRNDPDQSSPLQDRVSDDRQFVILR